MFETMKALVVKKILRVIIGESRLFAGVRKVKRCRIEAAVSLPQLKGVLEHGSCPKLDRTLERFGQCGGLKACETGATLPEFFIRMESGQRVY